MIITGFGGAELRLQVAEETQQIVSAMLINGDSALELGAYAAPRSGGLWPELREEIVEAATEAGGSAALVEGPFGVELRRLLPVTTPDGEQGYQPSRMWVVEGPRWLLRGILYGQAALEDHLDPPVADLLTAFREVVVRRGDEAKSPGDLLPLVIPPDVEPGTDQPGRASVPCGVGCGPGWVSAVPGSCWSVAPTPRRSPGCCARRPSTRGGSPATPVAPPTPPATNPALPVLAEAVWTSADGLGVQVRIGVHAVRRISGATVLDWSVTPLTAPNLQPGDPVPPTLDLGLSRPTDELPLISLLDARGDRLFRPLTSAADPLRCVCTPLTPARDRFRIGHTTVLQVAFPALPGSSTTVDVVMATAVAVRAGADHPRRSGPGGRSTRRAGPAAGHRVGRGGYHGDVPLRAGTSRSSALRLHRVLAGATFTTLEWTIWSVTGGEGLDAASSPPFAERAADGTEPRTGPPPAAPCWPWPRRRGRRLSGRGWWPPTWPAADRRSVSAARSTAGRRCCGGRTSRPPWSPPTRRCRPGPVGSRSVSTGWPRSRCR